MKDLFFITTRNIYDTNGEYSLINNRAKVLYKDYKFRTNIFAIANELKVKNLDGKILNEPIYSVKNIETYKSLNIIKAIVKSKKKLKEMLNEVNPQNIIISSPFVGIYYNVLKKYKKSSGCNLIYDMHGCMEELIEYENESKLKHRILHILYKFSKRYEKSLINICNGSMIVSQPMKEYIKLEYKVKENFKFYQIPCGLEHIHSDVQEMIKKRTLWREKMDVGEEEHVFVYSGGTSKWQLIEESIDLYESKLKKLFNSKFCIFSKDTMYIEDILEQKEYDRNNYILMSLKNYEVSDALLGCDTGILLREANRTNEVAFPNKFSEYIGSGLNIITTYGLKHPAKIVEKDRLGIVLKDIDLSQSELEHIKELSFDRSKDIKYYYSKCISISKSYLDYKNNLRELAKDLEG